jgi:quercetin dioxygenase-like cupin family protein
MSETEESEITDDYAVYEPDWDDGEEFPPEIDEGVNLNLIEHLGTEEMRPRLWRFEPDQQLSYHYHREQEELFYVVDGTLHFRVGPPDDVEEIEVAEGSFFKPGTRTPRQLFNPTDETAVCLIVGAPNVFEGQLWSEYDDDDTPTEGAEFIGLDEAL